MKTKESKNPRSESILFEQLALERLKRLWEVELGLRQGATAHWHMSRWLRAVAGWLRPQRVEREVGPGLPAQPRDQWERLPSRSIQ